MYLKKLALSNFKNHSESNFQFGKNINCFVGDNGSGKTNILDAIYYLSFAKSYFNSISCTKLMDSSVLLSIIEKSIMSVLEEIPWSLAKSQLRKLLLKKL